MITREIPPEIRQQVNDQIAEYLPIAQLIREAEIYPDFFIGIDYIARWWVAKIEAQHSGYLGPLRDHTRRTTDHNCYLHRMAGSDDDRAMHDHPWPNVSVVLEGTIREHTPLGSRLLEPGSVTFRQPEDLHRLELVDGPAWTLFLTGEKVREWGFMCPGGRWVHWKTFTGFDKNNPEWYLNTGLGCGEI